MTIARRWAWAVLLAVPSVPAFADAPPVARLELLWIEPDGSTPDQVAMKESAALLRRLGMDVTWTRAESLVVEAAQTPVILLRGLPLRAAGGSFVMGATHRGSASRAVWIYPDAVAATLGLAGIPTDGLSQQAFGLALGRVIVHELVHGLLQSPDHARFGLMAAGLDRQALLAPSLAVDPDTRRAVRRAAAVRSPAGVSVADGLINPSAPRPRYY